MAEINDEPTVCTRWRKRAILAGFVSGFFLVLAGTALLSAFFILSAGNRPCQPRNSLQCRRSSNSFAVEICAVVSVVLIISGVSITVGCYKTMPTSFPTPTAVSVIPTEDLEKSPSPILSHNHIPLRLATIYNGDAAACSTDLPDYFTAVLNIKDVSRQSNEGFWTEDIDADDESPPPCYEQALKMPGLSKYDLEARSSEDTRL